MKSILTINDLEVFYGDAQALFGASLSIAPGEFATLLGRNGMGKTTTVTTACGIRASRAGQIQFAGQDVTGWPSYRVARLGLGLVPEQRQVFPNLTVFENLVATAHNRLDQKDPWTLERVYGLFPRLKERASNLGCNLSGGEQQMLAIGRALMNAPRLLMLDEPVEGLAPVIVEEIVAQLKTIKAAGVTILLVEQNLEVCTQLADRHYIIEQGCIVHEAGNADFLADEAVKDRYLGVGLV